MHTRNIAMSAMFIALIFLSIYFLSVPNGFGGVIHFGDSLIFVGATLLPFPYGLIVAALGPGLFNLARVPIWFPFTIVIKPIMAACFTSKGDKILGSYRNAIAPVLAAVINTGLYFGANMLLFEGLPAGIAALPGLIIQGTGSVLFFFIIAAALDACGVKKILSL